MTDSIPDATRMAAVTESEQGDTQEVQLTPERVRSAIESALSTSPAGRIPTATYRVQFGEGFTFEDAARCVSYLERLGVSDLYTSPYLAARSAHGYDISDHNHLNPALGGEEAFRVLADELGSAGMGHIMDVVPNHMGIAGPENGWWTDVLENGPASRYSSYFDIDWQPLSTTMQNQVLLPVLGDQYGRVLERGELQLELLEGAFCLRYYDRVLPLGPRTYAPLLEMAKGYLVETLPDDDPAVIELESILTALSYLPGRTELDPERVTERTREKEVVKRRLRTLIEASDEAREAVSAAVTTFNGNPGDPRSFDPLDRLLADQSFRLSFWRVAAEEINYRRFFDVNELAAIRMELPEVFEESHRLVMRLITDGIVTGLRIDHPDGLWEPAEYFASLQVRSTVERARALLEEDFGPLTEVDRALLDGVAGEMTTAIAQARPLYVVAEKIVVHGEELPPAWPVHGTTGYEFLNSVGGLFVDGGGEPAITETYQRFTGESHRYNDLVYASKRKILQTSLASELNVLAHALNRLAERNRLYRDFTLGSLTTALREIVAAFPVYRTYITEQTESIDKRDRTVVEQAVRAARRRAPEMDPSVFDFVRDVLLLDVPDFLPEDRVAQRQWVMSVQQLTGPVMAKGLEDTTFYIFNRLVSLNEVGGEPQHFGTSPTVFHHENLERCRRAAHTMLTTSTHDTKRSEDVRARISVLSEMPEAWEAALERWSEQNRPYKAEVDEREAPDRNEEYLFYQTLVGSWPLEAMDEAAREGYTDRIVDYMMKAMREAKENSSWINQDQEYEAGAAGFIRAVLNDESFTGDFESFQRKIAPYGAINSLAQVTLKLTSPGVPDIYQGNEMWDFSLVDPDNRRPVDYPRMEQALAALTQRAAGEAHDQLARDLLENWQDGSIKLWVTHRALLHRRENPELFAEGQYRPLEAMGPAAAHAVAFMRTYEEQALVTVVPRLMYRLSEGADEPDFGDAIWAETSIRVPPGRYRNLFTGETLTTDGALELGELFAACPVALLELVEAA
jgi:(1->4)-alpha-D-glucan 1-alpha-D-glucosylmutase